MMKRGERLCVKALGENNCHNAWKYAQCIYICTTKAIQLRYKNKYNENFNQIRKENYQRGLCNSFRCKYFK